MLHDSNICSTWMVTGDTARIYLHAFSGVGNHRYGTVFLYYGTVFFIFQTVLHRDQTRKRTISGEFEYAQSLLWGNTQ